MDRIIEKVSLDDLVIRRVAEVAINNHLKVDLIPQAKPPVTPKLTLQPIKTSKSRD